ncbi:MAG TPA: PilN domain-containing protein [Longimicrobium sp.]|jgi:Tfp pilus assembly protein PilN
MGDNEDARAAPFRGAARIGIVVGPADAAAYRVTRAGTTLVAARSLPAAESEGWNEALADFMDEITHAVGRGPADATLLRPLAAVRTLRLPPLRRAALRSLAARGSDRWFPFAARGAVEATPPRGPGEPTVVSAARGSLVESLVRVASDRGVEIESVSAGAHAAATAVLHHSPRLARGRHRVALCFGHATEVITLDDGRLTGARSLPFVGSHADRAAQLREIAGADPEVALHLPHAVPEEVWMALGRDPEPSTGPATAEALAAEGATLRAARPHDLRPDELRVPARRAALRRTAILLAAASLLGATSAVTHLRRVDAAADRVAAARATLRPVVATVLRRRAEIDSLQARLAAIGEAESARSRWVPFFAHLAGSLPRDAYIQSLRADGGEIAVEGFARSASVTVLQMERDPAWTEVRFTAPLQREQTPTGERERFSLRFGAPRFHPASPDSARAEVRR